MKRILIAHQSTIPHYRVPFYAALERSRPESWCFDVVFDLAELDNPQFFGESIDINLFDFPLLTVHTYSATIGEKRVSYQTFLRPAKDYDLVIVENAVNNLTYPLCQFHQLHGIKYAHWGHGWDHSVGRPSLPKLFSEKLKLLSAKKADGFFAYTPGVKNYLIQQGLLSQRIFVVNNTIDINEQRRLFEFWQVKRQPIRQQLELQGKKTLLLVGRFTQNKRIDFLLEVLSILQDRDPAYHLLLAGGGGEFYNLESLPNITYLGPIVEPDQLAKVYVASDLFAFPGSVGLGPLQALCYDLPVVTIDSNTHGPEIDYLNDNNSIILEASTTPEAYAGTIFDLFEDQVKLRALKESIWPSIRHLTIAQMAQSFIHGINAILGT